MNSAKNITAPESAVSYKFKIPELSDLFEPFSPEQIHVTLEGAFNIIFSRPSQEQIAPEEVEAASNDDVVFDHEEQITSNVVFALFAHQSGTEVDEDTEVEEVPTSEIENSEQYASLEETFQEIVTKISNDIAADKHNQDVTTLFGEMEFFKRIELYTYYYDTKNEVLTVTLKVSND